MIRINEKVFQFENLKAGQVYAIIDADHVTMIDTGMMGDYGNIKRQLEDMNIKLRQIKNIIITHGHIDHTANVKKLAQLTGAKIYVHQGDLPKIQGKVNKEKLNVLGDGEIIDILGGMEIIHIPGHTDGNIAMYAKGMKLLFSGDNLFNLQKLSLPKEIYNKDTDGFKQRVKKLMDYDIKILCPGHGIYIDENCNEQIKELLSN